MRQPLHACRFAAECLQSDSDIVATAVRSNGLSFKYASATLQRDRTVALQAVSQNGLALQHMDCGLQSDVDIVLTAVRSSPGALLCASKVGSGKLVPITVPEASFQSQAHER